MPTSSRILLRAAAIVTLGTVILGCDKSNNQAVQDVNIAAGSVKVGNTTDALTRLQPYASPAGIPSGATISAKALRGHAKTDEAMVKIAKLSFVNADVARLGAELSQVAGAIASGNTLIAGFKMMDPAAARAQIKQQIADAEGGAGKDTWKGSEKFEVPTLAAGKAAGGKLAGEVSAKEAEIKKFEDQREATLKSADVLAGAVDQAKGHAAVDAFAKASAARKEIAGISNSIEVAQGELSILKGQMAVVTAQVAVVEKYVETLREKDKSLATGFEQVNAGVSSLSRVSAEAVSGKERNAVSLNAKAEELAKAVKESDDLYAEAHKLLQDAAGEYTAARTEAESFRKTLDDEIPPGKEASTDVITDLVKRTQKNVLPALYRSDLAITYGTLATIEGRHATVLAQRAALAKTTDATLKAAGLSAPASMVVKPEDVTAAKAEAAKSFGQSEAEFENAYGSIQGGDPLSNGRQNNITAARMFLHYANYQYLLASGDEKGAGDQLKEALKYRDQLKDITSFKMPALPPELVIVPVAPTPEAAPATTAPASGPTTTP